MIPSAAAASVADEAVYQRGLVIDSQPRDGREIPDSSISKGIGD